MDPFVAQIARLCAERPTRAKWVFVPSHALGRTLGDRLALGGVDWANLRFVTPLDIAARMGAPFLVERGIDPSEEGLGPALVMRLLLGLRDGPGYFRRLAQQPQMAMALWTTIRELRLAGLTAASLQAGAFASPVKHQELRALLEQYESFLATTHRGDAATVFEEAVRHPDWCPLTKDDCWTEWPNAIWAPLPRKLIESMPGERLPADTLELAGADVPRRLSAAQVRRRSPGAGAPLAFLLAPAMRPEAEEGMAPSFFHAGGAEAEVEEVCRRVLASGAPLDDVEIVCASPAYTTLVWEKACRHDWPATLAAGLPAAITRPGRALLGFAEWIEDDFASGRLRRLLQSGDVSLPRELGLTPGRAAALLVKAQAAWGRETYGLALGRLAASSRRRAARDDLADVERERLESRARDAEALSGWIETLVASVPVADGAGTIALQALVDAARRFVGDVAAKTSALDGASAVRLGQAIGELEALGAFRCPPGDGIRFLRERVEGLSVGADRPRPGHLHVSPLSHAGWSGRRVVFVLGVEEGRVFPAAFEDPVLLDAERRQIDPVLALSGDRLDEAVYGAVDRLAAMSQDGARICLSYSSRDLREFRETHASWLLLQAFRVSTRQPLATYRQLKDALGDPVSCVPAEAALAASMGRWWMNGLLRAGPDGRASVLAAFPPLSAGVAAAEARSSDSFTEYDGLVPEAGALLDPARADRVVSPTELEDAASCPFRYFLRRGLRIDALETGERDREVWLDPMTRGVLLHDLYAETLRRCRAEGRRPDAAVDGPWLEARGRETLAALSREMPPPSVDVEAREAAEFLADLALFLEAECAHPPSRTPMGFEVAFGRPSGPDEDGVREPLSRDTPIEIDIGGGRSIRLAGRIDRIDEVAPRQFEILDYKTGRFIDTLWKGSFAGGRRLQHALYGLAAMALLRARDPKATVSAAQYYFSSARGWQRRVRLDAPARAATSRVLADLRDVVAAGLFVHAADRDRDCKFCDFGAACGRGVHDAAAAKLGDERLAPFVRLGGHE
jgi:ATP-dependent helicase/nuclease subunit B